MDKIEKAIKGGEIMAELYGRPNSINGKYKKLQVGLDNLSNVNKDDIFFLETLKMKADMVDKMIKEFEAQGKDLKNPDVVKELSEEINYIATPIHRREAIMASIFVSLQLLVYYGVAIGVWGMVFKKGFLLFGIYGAILGFLISLITVPVIAFQRIRQKIKEKTTIVSMLWGNFAIIICILGLIVFGIALVFFK